LTCEKRTAFIFGSKVTIKVNTVYGKGTLAYGTYRMRQIEKERGKPIEEILEELCEKHTLLEEATAELGIDQGTVHI